MKSPTRRIRAVAGRLFDPATMERLIEPVLSDVELEQREAAASGRRWLARWTLLNGCYGLFKALALHGARVSMRAVAPDEAATRTLGFSVAAFVVLTVALVLPPLLDAHAPSLDGMLAVYLLPQALPFSIPAALAFGIACGWSHDATAATILRRVIILGIAGSVVALATMEWLVPAANQGFREAVVRRVGADNVHMPRGVNERSLSELASLVRQTSPERWPGADETVATAIREMSQGRATITRETLQLNLHSRIALSFATSALCLLAVAIASVIRRRSVARVVFVAMVVLYVSAYAGVETSARVLSPIPSAWLPNAILAAVSLVFLGVSSANWRGQA